jgi:hypothetical protein
MPALGRERARRNMGLAVGLSLLAHAAVFMIPVRERVASMMGQASAPGSPLAVRLLPPEEPAAVAAQAVPETLPPTSTPVPRARREARQPPAETAMARAAPATEPAPFRVPEPVAPPAPTFDMEALIRANRERRRAAEAAAQRRPERESPAEDAALANLNRNLQSITRSDGTGGVFHIMRMGGQTAEFAFNGWNLERRGRWREYIEVQAGPDGDLERAVVRRMIGLVREHYTGDFNWESHRLGRVLVLSAAPADNEALEEFMLREFFGTPLVKRGR